MKTQLKTNTWSHLLRSRSRSERPARDSAAATGGGGEEKPGEGLIEARRCGALPAAEILARCSRRRSKSSQGGGSSKGLRSAALQQLAGCCSPPLLATAHHRLPRGAIGRAGPSPPAFRAHRSEKGVSTGHQSVCRADSQP